MADFERLIRKALSTQDASSLEVRQVVYQSSRNALQKIIDNNRSLTVEAVMAQKNQLEDSIKLVETELTAPPKEPEPLMPEPIAPAPVQVQVPQPQPQSQAKPEPQPAQEPIVPTPVAPQKAELNDPLHEIQQILESTTVKPPVKSITPTLNEPAKINLEPKVEEPALVSQADVAPSEVDLDNHISVDDIEVRSNSSNNNYEQPENVPLGFQKRRKTQKRIFWVIVNLLILGLLAWIIYLVAIAFLNSSLLNEDDNIGVKLNPNSVSQQADSEDFITIINADDLSSLVIAGQGKAEIVNQLNSEMIRVHSVRDALNRTTPAAPILIRLKPGVLEQISGKRVTVEIFAKSGDAEQAHFAVGCEFGVLTECGRKRFLAGSQPNASVFAFQMDTVSDINQDAFITLSTDATNDASVTGKGDTLDIVYIRLSADN